MVSVLVISLKMNVLEALSGSPSLPLSHMYNNVRLTSTILDNKYCYSILHNTSEYSVNITNQPKQILCSHTSETPTFSPHPVHYYTGALLLKNRQTHQSTVLACIAVLMLSTFSAPT